MLVAQGLATFLKMLRSIALSLLLLILLTWNLGTLNTAAKEALAMIPRIQQFEASGVKLVLKDEAKLRAALLLALDGALSEERSREAVEAIKVAQKLTGPQVDRLFTIVPGSSHCDYTLANAKMRLYIHIDAELEELGLIKTAADPLTYDKVMASIAESGSDIGKPRNCYSMTVTALGFNAKSALVGVIRQALT